MLTGNIELVDIVIVAATAVAMRIRQLWPTAGGVCTLGEHLEST